MVVQGLPRLKTSRCPSREPLCHGNGSLVASVKYSRRESLAGDPSHSHPPHARDDRLGAGAAVCRCGKGFDVSDRAAQRRVEHQGLVEGEGPREARQGEGREVSGAVHVSSRAIRRRLFRLGEDLGVWDCNVGSEYGCVQGPQRPPNRCRPYRPSRLDARDRPAAIDALSLGAHEEHLRLPRIAALRQLSRAADFADITRHRSSAYFDVRSSTSTTVPTRRSPGAGFPKTGSAASSRLVLQQASPPSVGVGSGGRTD